MFLLLNVISQYENILRLLTPINYLLYPVLLKNDNDASDRLQHIRSRFTKSLMVSVAISKMGFTTLILADHGVNVNVKHYRDILQSQQMLTAVKSVTRDTFIFQPISLVRSFSCCNATLRLHRCDLWPPSSPDLNSDDYKISSVMQRQ